MGCPLDFVDTVKVSLWVEGDHLSILSEELQDPDGRAPPPAEAKPKEPFFHFSDGALRHSARTVRDGCVGVEYAAPLPCFSILAANRCRGRCVDVDPPEQARAA